jgi:hypothetical protein
LSEFDNAFTSLTRDESIAKGWLLVAGFMPSIVLALEGDLPTAMMVLVSRSRVAVRVDFTVDRSRLFCPIEDKGRRGRRFDDGVGEGAFCRDAIL